jgi:NAD-specific glutamate dehydrogenase
MLSPSLHRTLPRQTGRIRHPEDRTGARKKNELELDLYRPEDIDLKQLRLKVYNPGTPLTLSDVMPIWKISACARSPNSPLKSSLRECDHIRSGCMTSCVEIPMLKVTAVNIRRSEKEFRIRLRQKSGPREMENDTLNKLILILAANMNWHMKSTILRTYVRYLRQINSPFSQPYIQNRRLTQQCRNRRAIDRRSVSKRCPRPEKCGKFANHRR